MFLVVMVNVFSISDFYQKVMVRFERVNLDSTLILKPIQIKPHNTLLSNLVSDCYKIEDENGLCIDTITLLGNLTQKKEGYRVEKYEPIIEVEQFLYDCGVNTRSSEIQYLRTGAILMQAYVKECRVGEVQSLLRLDVLQSLTLNLIRQRNT